MKRVLAVTLYSGEAEFEQCCLSLNQQQNVVVSHEIIHNLPKHQAHQELYKLFNNKGKNYDFLIKLDADMVFSRNDSLAKLISKFKEGVDAVYCSVWDRMTQSRIWSINTYRSSCLFDYEANDQLFTDRVPVKCAGKSISVLDEDKLVLHAPDPSDFQAFMFGVHRAFKVIQPNVRVPRLEASFHQLRTLRLVQINYSTFSDQKALYALFGSYMVFSGKIKETQFHSKEHFRRYFEAIDVKGFKKELATVRMPPNALIDALVHLGPFRFSVAVVNYILRKGIPIRIGDRHSV